MKFKHEWRANNKAFFYYNAMPGKVVWGKSCVRESCVGTTPTFFIAI